jgi:hypothetical protein
MEVDGSVPTDEPARELADRFAPAAPLSVLLAASVTLSDDSSADSPSARSDARGVPQPDARFAAQPCVRPHVQRDARLEAQHETHSAAPPTSLDNRSETDRRTH